MADAPDLSDVGEESDPVGDLETRKVQASGRVDIPNEYLEHHESGEGSKVVVVCEEDGIKIKKATLEALDNNGR